MGERWSRISRRWVGNVGSPILLLPLVPYTAASEADFQSAKIDDLQNTADPLSKRVQTRDALGGLEVHITLQKPACFHPRGTYLPPSFLGYRQAFVWVRPAGKGQPEPVVK